MNTGQHTVNRPSLGAPRRVIVVDGSPDVLELLESALEGGQYNLMFAEAGHHAYSIIKREQPDLIVLTVQIDAIEGFQLLSMLKLDEETRDIPIVTLTADVDTSEELEDDEEEDERIDLASTTPRLVLH